MRVTLVGADFEENLGLGMLSACARRAGHRDFVVPFDEPGSVNEVVRDVLATRPDVVGLAIQFQHRAAEFLDLARRLRRAGFEGHLSCGGQFPTLAAEDVLRHNDAVDSVVLHEGEQTLPALLDALDAGTPLSDVAGLALRDEDGAMLRTPPRPLLRDLDELPFPTRYRPHARHMGVPFIPIMGGRGCWGACAYCSITSFYRDARAHGGGPMLRHRSPEDVATEMALLWHAAGGQAVFCFHDDNFLLPKPEASLKRIRAIRAALDDLGVGKAAMIGKCRPDSLTPELAKELAALGVIRLYVGVENASQRGSDHLNRKNQTACVSQALRACREAGIFVCYNLLIFEPDARVDDIRENVAFMRDHAQHPVNFCRAEPYVGTPLCGDLESRKNLGGSYLGHGYRITDDQTELLFRVCSSAFRQRNFEASGVANRSMGLGYSLKLLEFFHESAPGPLASLQRRSLQLTRAIVLETASFLDTAMVLVEQCAADEDALMRETALLGLRVAAADRVRHAELDAIHADFARLVTSTREPIRERPKPPPRLLALAQTALLGASLATWTEACSCEPIQQIIEHFNPTPVVDPVVPPADPLPIDPPTLVNDPLPLDPPPQIEVTDPAPMELPTTEQDTTRSTTMRHRRRRPPRPYPIVNDPVPRDFMREQVPPNDPPPPDMPLPDPVPRDPPSMHKAASTDKLLTTRLIDQWRDTTQRRAMRSNDLAMHAPPVVSLNARREEGIVHVSLLGGPEQISLRWEGDGAIEGEGRGVRWTPETPTDQIRVAVRSKGGVAVVALRAATI
ncbi:MAG: B12-binding domain-containing radical SAM protein [Deltaproteobacteria bacterium]|nr:B12-binding domain-containing radical SAM protein [Deltaproteobacteria bacterium]